MNFTNKAARQDFLLKQEIVAGGITPQPAPTIEITDPLDPVNVQEAFDSLVNLLKSAGVILT